MLQPTPNLLSTVPHLASTMASRPGNQAWSKDLRLYEGYKVRRNELRLRSFNRRWEHEKALSQIADIVSHWHTCALDHSRVCVRCLSEPKVFHPQGARPSREDQAEGRPLEGQAETTGLSGCSGQRK